MAAPSWCYDSLTSAMGLGDGGRETEVHCARCVCSRCSPLAAEASRSMDDTEVNQPRSPLMRYGPGPTQSPWKAEVASALALVAALEKEAALARALLDTPPPSTSPLRRDRCECACRCRCSGCLCRGDACVKLRVACLPPACVCACAEPLAGATLQRSAPTCSPLRPGKTAAEAAAESPRWLSR